MNLAWADIRHHFLRFVIMTIGISALFTATIGMIGLYRGVVYEALLMINGVDADIWISQGDRAGPFAETSEIPGNLDRRLEGVPGVASARRFIQFNQQYEIGGRRLRIAVTGLDFPKDAGSWIPLAAGRHLYSGHYEAIADRSLGLVLGDEIRLGRDAYTIVGIAIGQVDMAGDGVLFVTIPDAQMLNTFAPSEAILLDRADKAASPPVGFSMGRVGAVMVALRPGADPEQVRNYIRNWGDVAVLTRDDEEDILLNGRLWRLRIQILAFVAMTLMVTTIVVGLSIYTMTLEKTHQIALLKLIGARDSMIVGMILQQALLIGANSFAWAIVYAHLIFPHFPRTVLIQGSDVAVQAAMALLMCSAASWFGIRKALGVRAQDVLS
ncbi:putative ABC transport system permease protein [Rhizobiales bacterium GAS188]|nr:putative ABC transport system permease protein [Rhizobiales bacterium GAS188]